MPFAHLHRNLESILSNHRPRRLRDRLRAGVAHTWTLGDPHEPGRLLVVRTVLANRSGHRERPALFRGERDGTPAACLIDYRLHVAVDGTGLVPPDRRAGPLAWDGRSPRDGTRRGLRVRSGWPDGDDDRTPLDLGVVAAFRFLEYGAEDWRRINVEVAAAWWSCLADVAPEAEGWDHRRAGPLGLALRATFEVV